MNDRTPPTLQKWPFLIMDLLVIAGCSWMVWQAMPPKDTLDHVIILAGIAGWIFAACIGIYPWVIEFKAQTRLEETAGLADALEQIKKLEDVGNRVQAASTSWQGAHDAAAKVVGAAKDVQEKIHADSKDFMSFVERVNSEEKKHLKLEVEKLRRAETEFLQVTVRMLDHTFALNQAAARSGQPHLIQQLGHFQNACRDTARRVGLVAYVPAVGEKFDSRAHQTAPPSEPPADSAISEILAAGYTFQGQLLRRALVQVSQPSAAPQQVEPEPAAAAEEPPTAPIAEEPAPEPIAEEAPVQPAPAPIAEEPAPQPIPAEAPVEPAREPAAKEPPVEALPQEEVAITAPKAQMVQELENTKPAKRARKPDPQVTMQF